MLSSPEHKSMSSQHMGTGERKKHLMFSTLNILLAEDSARAWSAARNTLWSNGSSGLAVHHRLANPALLPRLCFLLLTCL